MESLHKKVIDILRSDSNRSVRRRSLKYSTSSNKGDSPLRNIKFHRENRFFYLIDFANAFKNVDCGILAKVLLEFKPFAAYRLSEVESFVSEHFMDPRGGLAQGGNASSILFNIYTGLCIDINLSPILDRYGITYTRYVDDLIFSSKKPITGSDRREIRRVIEEADFWINHKKCQVVDLKKLRL